MPSETESPVSGLPSPNPTKSLWMVEAAGCEVGRLLQQHEHGESQPPLPQEADVVIVGSGITAAFAAYFLLRGKEGRQLREIKKDLRVVMVEAREACSGASGRNCGRVEPVPTRSAPDMCGFELEGFRLLRDLVESEGVSCDWHEVMGVNAYHTRHLYDLVDGYAVDLEEMYPPLGEMTERIGPARPRRRHRTSGRGDGDGARDDDNGVSGLSPSPSSSSPIIPATSPLSVSRRPTPATARRRTNHRGAFVGGYGDASEDEEEDYNNNEDDQRRQQTEMAATKRRLANLGLDPDSVDGAFVHANAATVQPYKLVAWVLTRLLQDERFQLHTHTPVTAISKTAGGGVDEGSRNTGNSHPWTLTTPRGSISAEQVLLATNGYTSALLPALADLLVPIRGQVAALVVPPPSSLGSGRGRSQTEETSLLHGRSYGLYSWEMGSENREDYFREILRDNTEGKPVPTAEEGRRRSNIVFAGGRHLAAGLGVGEWRDDEIEPEVSRFLRGRCIGDTLNLWSVDGELDGDTDGSGTRTAGTNGGVKPEELEATFEWTGIHGFSRDRYPWVGPVPEFLGGGEGLFICAGYTGHGLTVAPLCAKSVVRDMVATIPALSGKRDDKKEQEEEVDEELDVARVPVRFGVTRERIQGAREDWDSVEVTEEEGAHGLLSSVIGTMIKGKMKFEHKLTVHKSLRRIDSQKKQEGSRT